MRKHRRRKVYPLVNPVANAIAGACVTGDELLAVLRRGDADVLAAMQTGQATQDDLRKVCDLVNLTQTMAHHGIGPEALPSVLLVEGETEAAIARFARTRKVGFTGPGLVALRELIEWHDLQRISVSRSVYERMINKTCDRIRSAHPDLKVFT
jgi:hypothetical protein